MTVNEPDYSSHRYYWNLMITNRDNIKSLTPLSNTEQ